MDVFIGYGSEIHLVEAEKRQRKPRSAQYRDAWQLILQWVLREETCVPSLELEKAVSTINPLQCQSKERHNV